MKKSTFRNKKASGRASHPLASVLVIVAFIAQFFVPLASNAVVTPTNPSNPSLGQSCGLDIALVLDSSDSIDNTELAQMKTAFKGFVDTFLPGTPTQFSVTDFDSTATVVGSFSGNPAVVKSAVDTPTSGGATNWEDGLIKAQSTFDPRPVPNLIIFSSDGNPNRYGNNLGPGHGFDQAALDAAVVQANIIKNAGTRIITLGIGSDVVQANLEAISSSDAYYSAADFSSLAQTLQALVTDLCGGTITAHKIIDADGNIQTTNDQTPGAGWSFNVAGHADATDNSGKTLAWEVNAGTYNVTEAVEPGYSFITASCSGATYNGDLAGQNQISNIQVGDEDIVSCYFYNSPNAGTLTVYKHVNNNYGGEAVAGDFHIVVNDGALGSFQGDENGTQISVPAGMNYLVQENGMPDGYAVSYDGCSGTMALEGSATCTITNDQINPHASQGTITVVKNVVNDNGGQAGVSDFTLKVNDAVVANGQSNYFDEGDYVISEDMKVSGYNNTGTVCVDGQTQTQGSAVHLDAGHTITCTVTNDDIAPTLKLVKNVDNSQGGNGTAADWALSATHNQDGFTDLGNSNTAHPITANLYYALTESPVQGFDSTGYTPGAWSCQGGGSFDLQTQSINLIPGENAICTITNTYVPPETTAGSLTICKYSDKGVIGQYEPDTDTPLAWDMKVTYPNQDTLDTATNGETGCVTIEGLPFGEYSITEASQTNWARSYPVESNTQTAIIDIETNPTVYFLNYLTADVGLTKSVEPSSVQSGQQATFILNVTNHGPADASGVLVTDSLPSGLTFVSANATVGSYDNSTDLWTIGNLANGSSTTLTIVATVSGSDGQQIVNQATVTIEPDIDINADNNTASATITVTVPGQGGDGSTNPPQTPPPGGNGGGGNGPLPPSDAYQNWLQQQAAGQPAPRSEVAGATTPPGEVKGASTFLPGTGFDYTEGLLLIMVLGGLIGIFMDIRKKVFFVNN